MLSLKVINGHLIVLFLSNDLMTINDN